MLSFMSKYKQNLVTKKTYVFNNNIEKLAPFNRLYGATRLLHLINYLEPLVAQNSQLNWATLSLGWLQIAYPNKKTKKITKHNEIYRKLLEGAQEDWRIEQSRKYFKNIVKQDKSNIFE